MTRGAGKAARRPPPREIGSQGGREESREEACGARAQECKGRQGQEDRQGYKESLEVVEAEEA